MRCIITFLLTALFLTVAHARQVTLDEARTIATDFFANKAMSRNGQSSEVEHVSRTYGLRSESVNAPYYIFNAENNRGFVIVSGDSRTNRILGYSMEGHIDTENITPQFSSLLDRYADGILNLGDKEPIKTKSVGKSVGPLITSTWGQNAPYNKMLPLIYDGNPGVTGCVNTAQAQIMRYHKWPVRGTGFVSYDWNGQTLSVDLSDSVYDWDNMLDSYVYDGVNNPNEIQENAVALLMRDCAYANETVYGEESGASGHYDRLINNFGYDKGIRGYNFQLYSVEEAETMMREELDAGRPMIVGGAAGNGASAHEFICDGYDSDGYFHYNFGWDGYHDGYFLSTATGFDIGLGVSMGIQPECGGKMILNPFSYDDFEYDNGAIKCCVCCGGFVLDLPIFHEVATICENTANGHIQYFIGYQGVDWFNVYELPLPEALADGEYILYPAIREKDGEWIKYRFPKNRQAFIDLKVVNQEMIFSNNQIVDDMDDGKIKHNGIYYILHDGNVAEVTCKNNKYSSYSGDVHIPESIEVNGIRYSVTEIGNDAFRDSKIGLLTIPKSINIIKSAFFCCNVESIVFEQPSSLERIYGWGFNACYTDEIILPEGVGHIGSCAFQTSTIKKVDIPRTVYTFQSHPFNACQNLRQVIVHWETEDELPNLALDYHLFDQCNWNEITLYVPDGTKNMYSVAPQWSDLNIKEISELSGCEDVEVDNSTAHTIYYDLYGRKIDGVPTSGMYIKVSGNKVTKEFVR